MSATMDGGDDQPRLGDDQPRRGGRAAAGGGPERPGTAGGDPLAAAGGELTYERASGRIEEIIRRLDSGEAGLRETLELVAEGRRLVEYCAAELDAVSRGLQELRLDELIARLERGGEPDPGRGEAR